MLAPVLQNFKRVPWTNRVGWVRGDSPTIATLAAFLEIIAHLTNRFGVCIRARPLVVPIRARRGSGFSPCKTQFSGAKAQFIQGPDTARLKPRPDTKHL